MSDKFNNVINASMAASEVVHDFLKQTAGLGVLIEEGFMDNHSTAELITHYRKMIIQQQEVIRDLVLAMGDVDDTIQRLRGKD